jgi:hypothetical protein
LVPGNLRAFSPILQKEREKALADEAARKGLNREQRRKFFKLALRGGERQQQNLWGSLSPEAIIAQYPMRPEDAKVLRDYFGGKATSTQAENAFLASLRDPSWMMRWFGQHSDAMTPIVEWMRGPARKLRGNMAGATSKLSALVLEAKERREKLLALDIEKSVIDTMPIPDVKGLGSRSIVDVARRLISEISKSESADFEVHDLDLHAPGLATALHTFFEVISRSIGVAPRALKDSDFVDVIHSMYAPYVDIFRADAFMAPVLRQTQCGQSIVVARLPELPDVIERELKHRA